MGPLHLLFIHMVIVYRVKLKHVALIERLNC